MKTSTKRKAISKKVTPDINYESKGYRGWKDDVADALKTTEQVKDWNKFKPQGEVNETPINYWKYACIAILLGLVAGMIISTPFIINAVEVCSQ